MKYSKNTVTMFQVILENPVFTAAQLIEKTGIKKSIVKSTLNSNKQLFIRKKTKAPINARYNFHYTYYVKKKAFEIIRSEIHKSVNKIYAKGKPREEAMAYKRVKNYSRAIQTNSITCHIALAVLIMDFYQHCLECNILEAALLTKDFIESYTKYKYLYI